MHSVESLAEATIQSEVKRKGERATRKSKHSVESLPEAIIQSEMKAKRD
jgi:hypothetical protein